jgi:hypothetical protein
LRDLVALFAKDVTAVTIPPANELMLDLLTEAERNLRREPR